MSYLLDTNVVSELRKGARSSAKVRTWIASVADDDLYLSVLVVGELRQGIERLRKRDPSAVKSIGHWFDALVERYASRVIPIDAVVAEQWGRLNVPDPLSAVDGLLAATALVHDLTLVTRNVRDVKRTGVRVLDPFT